MTYYLSSLLQPRHGLALVLRLALVGWLLCMATVARGQVPPFQLEIEVSQDTTTPSQQWAVVDLYADRGGGNPDLFFGPSNFVLALNTLNGASLDLGAAQLDDTLATEWSASGSPFYRLMRLGVENNQLNVTLRPKDTVDNPTTAQLAGQRKRVARIRIPVLVCGGELAVQWVQNKGVLTDWFENNLKASAAVFVDPAAATDLRPIYRPLANDTTFCQGDNFTLKSTVQGDWYRLAAGSQVQLNGAVSDSQPVSFSGPRVDTLLFDRAGCRDTLIASVSNPRLVTPSADTAICPGGNIDFLADTTVAWFRLGSPVNPASKGVTLGFPNSDTVDIVIEQGGQCYDTLTVNVPPSPSVAVLDGPDTLCLGAADTLFASGAPASNSLQWQRSRQVATGYTNLAGATDTFLALPTGVPDTGRWYYRLRTRTVCDTVSEARPVWVSKRPVAAWSLGVDSICPLSQSSPLGASVVQTDSTGGVGQWSLLQGNGQLGDLALGATRYQSDSADAGQQIRLRWRVRSAGCPDSSLTDSFYVRKFPDGQFSGPLAAVCQGDTSAVLNASVVSSASSGGVGRWEAAGGANGGAFLNPNLATTRYATVAAEADSTLELLWIVRNGPCREDTNSQSLFVGITPQAFTVTPPPDTLCVNQRSPDFNAVATQGVGVWSTTGNGAFSSPNSNITDYLATETGAPKSLTISFVALSGSCTPFVLDYPVTVVDSPQAVFPALAPDSLCPGDTSQPLGASVGSATGTGRWVKTGGNLSLGSFTDSLNGNSRYLSDPAEAGSTVQLSWVVDNNGCQADTQTRSLIILPVKNDGDFNTALGPVCAAGQSPPLGAALLAGVGRWYTLPAGKGSFVDTTDPNTRYQAPATLAADTDSVQLCWEVRDPDGFCTPKTFCQTQPLYRQPAGSFVVLPNSVCVGDTTDTLVGDAFVGQGFWSCSNCNGAFSNPFGPKTVYYTHPADADQDLVISWNVSQPSCANAVYTDTLHIFGPSDGATPVQPDTICAGENTAPLAAVVNLGAGRWETPDGAGGFSNTANPNARYVSTAADSGSNLTLWWIVENGTCPADTNTLNLHVLATSRGAFNTVIPDVCVQEPTIPLGAQAFNGVGIWSSSGAGSFSPGNNDPNARFVPALADSNSLITLTWTVVNGVCDTVRYSRQVFVNEPSKAFMATISPDSLCPGEQTAPLSGSGNDAGFWSTVGLNSGSYVDIQNPNTRYTASFQDAGRTVVLEWVVNNATCPAATARDSVYIYPVPTFSAGSDTAICPGESVQLTATGGEAYQWLNGLGSLSDLNTGTPVATPPDTFDYVVAIFTNNLNCRYEDTVRINVRPVQPLDPPVQNLTNCSSEPLQISVSGAQGDYQWFPSQFLDDPTLRTPTTRPTQSITYRVVARQSNGCLSDTSVVNIDVLPAPVPSLTGAEVCQGFPLEVAASATDSCQQLYYFNAPLLSVIQVGPPYNSSHPNFLQADSALLLSTDNPTSYAITAACVNNNFQCVGFAEAEYTVLPAPVAEFTVDRTRVPFADRRVFFNESSNGADRFQWVFGDTASGAFNQDTVPNPSHTFSAAGLYTITLLVENQNGCSDLSIETDLVEVLPETFSFPTAFTPDGDGLNDLFQALPADVEIDVQQFEVFDRWGNLVYRSANNQGWNGRAPDGQVLDAGVYTYRVVVNLTTRGVEVFTGKVTLLR